jgi:hypothetical protein
MLSMVGHTQSAAPSPIATTKPVFARQARSMNGSAQTSAHTAQRPKTARAQKAS